MSEDDRKHEVIDQGKDRKRSSKRKFTDKEYNVQDNAAVSHKDVKMYCDTNQLPTFPFCGSHTNLMEQGSWVSIIIYVLIQI